MKSALNLINAELDAIRNRLLNIRDVVGSRRGQN